MKENRKKVVLCMFLIILTVCLGACQKGKKEEENAKNLEESEETKKDAKGKEEYPAGTFDFEKACESLTIDGKRVGIPFTLDDLGEEYVFDPACAAFETQTPNVYGGGLLMPDGKSMFIRVKEDGIENIKRTSEIIYVQSLDGEFDVEIAGIKCMDSPEELLQQLGEPMVKSPSPVVKNYEFWDYTNGEDSANGYISFFIGEGKIDSIKVRVK